MPTEAALSPKAAARVAREAATHSFDDGARALNIDWGTSFDGKQIQRWGEALGRTLVEDRNAQLQLFQRGHLPPCKENEHELLVIGMDGGRVQTREKSEETGSRWKEDKVLTITSCLKGDGQTDQLLKELVDLSAQAGLPVESDPQNHPRKVLAANAGYFQKHKDHTDYPTYRSKGWPIGSGITESGVKRFGKRVKGTEQFWNESGVEAILALQSKWLSEDEESAYYWLGRQSKAKAA